MTYSCHFPWESHCVMSCIVFDFFHFWRHPGFVNVFIGFRLSIDICQLYNLVILYELESSQQNIMIDIQKWCVIWLLMYWRHIGCLVLSESDTMDTYPNLWLLLGLLQLKHNQESRSLESVCPSELAWPLVEPRRSGTNEMLSHEVEK